MKRLLFLHLRKTGGSSFRSWLEGGNSDDTFKINESVVSLSKNEIRQKLLNAKIIEVHNLATPLNDLVGDDEWWSLFQKDLFKVVLVRNPCDQIASEFRYWHQFPEIGGLDFLSQNFVLAHSFEKLAYDIDCSKDSPNICDSYCSE